MFRVLASVALLASAAAFMPANRVVRQTQITMSAETMQSKISKALATAAMGVALLAPISPVVADGAVSKSTVYRARNSYGLRILGLEEAANKGDFSAFDNKKASGGFDLFISASNALGGKVAKETKAAETKIKGDIYAAVKAKDAAKLRAAYSEFIKVADLKSDFKAGELGQTDSSGYSPTWGTAKQYIYQR